MICPKSDQVLKSYLFRFGNPIFCKIGKEFFICSNIVFLLRCGEHAPALYLRQNIVVSNRQPKKKLIRRFAKRTINTSSMEKIFQAENSLPIAGICFIRKFIFPAFIPFNCCLHGKREPIKFQILLKHIVTRGMAVDSGLRVSLIF